MVLGAKKWPSSSDQPCQVARVPSWSVLLIIDIISYKEGWGKLLDPHLRCQTQLLVLLHQLPRVISEYIV